MQTKDSDIAVIDRLRSLSGSLGRSLFRASNIPTAITLMVILAAGAFAEHQNRVLDAQSQRSQVLDRVALTRARLEGNINANIQLVRGLVSMIAQEPDIGQERFAAISSSLFRHQTQLRHIAAAPDLVLAMAYPLDGNEAAIGLDYRDVPEQRISAERARRTGEMVFAGPVALVQGGHAFIGRFPVSTAGPDGAPAFWGIVSAVIDADRLYAESGIAAGDPDLDLALIGRDGRAEDGEVFFGDPGILARDPVLADILLPSGSWRIAAVPDEGWGRQPPNTWQLRAAVGMAGALLLVPVFLAGRLNHERHRRILEEKYRRMELARLSRRLELALATSQLGVWEYDIATGRLTWDDRMNEIYGLPADRSPRDLAHWRAALHPDDLERAREDFRHALERRERYDSSFRIVTPQGEIRHVRAMGAFYEDPGAPARILGVNWDATADVRLNEALMKAKTQAEAKNGELEAAKARIEHNALHDSLTGLPNRRYLDEMLERHVTPGARNGVAAILHIDLDRFKQINDTLGHAAGDAMLIHTAEILKTCVRGTDFVARIGGDEFVVLCLGHHPSYDLGQLADRIIEKMRRPVSYRGHECRFGVSVGIASATDQIGPKQLLVNADIALYRAKSRGRSRYEFFSTALQAEIVTSKRVADDILNGLDNDEFVAHFQPQFDAKTLDLVGVEALARWRHPVEGVLMPSRFMRIAEDLNVVGTLDRLVLEQSLAWLARWNRDGHKVPRVSVNVSARRLHDEKLIENLRSLAIAPGLVSFELIESIYLDESDEIVAWNIDQIKDLGIDIEIDDFGTGYASIVSLLKLRPARLKIDRQLVMPITSSNTQRALVESIIEIGSSLGIKVVAEGIETPEHVQLLREIGCDALQGFALARPMEGEKLAGFLAAETWRRAG